MKRIALLALITCAGAGTLFSQDRGFGLGVIIGEPTGISGKYWVSRQNAIDGAVAWSFRGRGFFHIHADYLWHFPDAIRAPERFVPYVGVGGRLGISSGDGIVGIRIVGGLDWWARNAPIDVFLEIAPIVDLTPATELTANGGVGIRFYFR